MNANKEKMMKMSKVLSIILFSIAIAFIAMISILIMFVLLAPVLDFELTLEQVNFLTTTPDFSFNDLDGIRAWMTDMVLGSVLMISVLFVAGSIFKAISREGTPFTKKNSDKIRIIALLLIANEVVIPPLQMLVKMIAIPGLAQSAEIRLINIVVAAMFFCLALIFDYGRQLQQESDETL